MRLDHTKLKLHPYAECQHDGCPLMIRSGPDTRERAKEHVHRTGHPVLVVVEERSLYTPEDPT